MTRPRRVWRNGCRYSCREADGGLCGYDFTSRGVRACVFAALCYTGAMDEIESNDLIERAYRVRLRLTREQFHSVNRLFGVARNVWNWVLETRTTAYRERDGKLTWVAGSALYTHYRQAPGTE